MENKQKVSNHNNIVKNAKEAIYKQRAKIVLFEIGENTKKVQEELDKLKRMGIEIHYYFTDNESKIHSL